jgi:hypothetical protein
MLLIYSQKITPRFRYVANHIFGRLMGIDIIFATKVEEFIKHSGPKITYGKQPLQNEFFIQSYGLLDEQGINDHSIKMTDWEGLPTFFRVEERSELSFDIFSATFYLLSRYEEYLPHVKDGFGRFPASASVAFKHGFLELPLVDLWAQRFKSVLLERFPEMITKKRTYVFCPIIDVTTSHKYAFRGVLRGTGGFMGDVVTLKLGSALRRILVVLGIRKDPYDNFDALIRMQKDSPSRLMFFFQFAAFSQFDKNVSVYNRRFKNLIKSVADYAIVSLASSFASFDDLETLKLEKKNLSNVLHRVVKFSRLRYNRVEVPGSYRQLVAAEFTDDFSMGYTHAPGFRAGTCSPFYFYDINQEIQQPIRIHPFALHDYALLACKDLADMQSTLKRLYDQVVKVQGEFAIIFSNELIGGARANEWKAVVAKSLKVFHG